MPLNNFFLVKFYTLNFSWIQSVNNWNNLNRHTYYQQRKIAFIFMHKTLFYLKKTFGLIKKVLSKLGSISILGYNNYYFKDIELKNYFLRQNLRQFDVYKGIFSNHLYIKETITIPDLFLIFDYSDYTSFIKELKTLGVIVVGIVKKSNSLLCDYPIILNDSSYFTKFFILNTYSKIILLNKV